MVHKRTLASSNTQQTSRYTILERNAIFTNTHQGSLQEIMFIESKCSTVNMFVRESLSGSCLEANSYLCFYLTCTFSEWIGSLVCFFPPLRLNKFKKDCSNWNSSIALCLCQSLVLNPISCHSRSVPLYKPSRARMIWRRRSYNTALMGFENSTDQSCQLATHYITPPHPHPHPPRWALSSKKLNWSQHWWSITIQRQYCVDLGQFRRNRTLK